MGLDDLLGWNSILLCIPFIIYWGGLPAVPSVRYVKLSVDYEEVVTASCGRGKKTLLSWVRAAALKVF